MVGVKEKISKSEEKELKHHTRRLSIKEGIFWSARSSFGDQYIAPFTIAMGASNSLVTILNSVWNLGPISQLLGSKLVGKHKRKAVLTKTMTLESIGWLLMLLTAIAYYKDYITKCLPYSSILSLAIIVFAGGLGHPSWFSWIGDIVDDKFRGRWFAKRSTIISFTTIILALIASLVLNYSKNIGQEKIGFIILFSIAFLARFYCVSIINRHYEPKLKIKKTKNYSLKQFIKESKSSNFGKFTLFRGMFAMIVGLTAPLTSIYLLRYLGFDYVSYIAIMLSGTLFSVLTLNLWGKLADKYGNYKVIAITTLLIPLTPLLWILSPSKIYLFLVPAILGGTTWSAFIMASGNFIYDNVSKEKRAKAISYFNLFTGTGAFIGGIIASSLIDSINTKWIEPIFLIYIGGSLLRMILIGIWIPKLKEIQKKEKLKGFKALENIVLREVKPTLIEDMHEIASVGKYIKER